jgi:cellulose synthase/poly-beta-1,6-N-acetylglucosamine synthase-like glycosyltransferase
MTLIHLCIFFYILKILVYLVFFKKSEILSDSDLIGEIPEGPEVNIIVPMFNEEKVIASTIASLRNITYPNLKIIAVDDGSTDNTLKVLKDCFSPMDNFKIITQPNRGKSFALNNGISQATANIIVCIDADTMVLPNVIHKLLPYFNDSRVAAVAGNIIVANRNNLITEVQYVEYITNPNYERSVFESLNGILVIPGAIGAFKKDIILSIGGYSAETMTEDTDLTLKLLCNNYIVRNAPDVYGFTEAPETALAFFNQRVRWKVGTFQVLIKYWEKAHKTGNRFLSLMIIPYTLLYGIILPFIIPLNDYYLLYKIVFFRDITLIPSYLCLIVLDTLICLTILLQKREHMILSWYIIFQRMLLRHLYFLTYFWMVVKGFRGNLFSWSRSIRSGNNQVG